VGKAATGSCLPDNSTFEAGQIHDPDRIRDGLTAAERFGLALGASRKHPDKGHALAIGRPDRVHIAVNIGQEPGNFILGKVVNTDKAVSFTDTHKKNFFAIG